VDELVDWLTARNREGYQMANSVARLQEMKAFLRMSRRSAAAGDEELFAGMPGIVRDEDGRPRFTDWDFRAGQNNVIIRTDSTLGPCFPMYSATYDWGNIDGHKFRRRNCAK
jgi:hypothetical protein